MTSERHRGCAWMPRLVTVLALLVGCSLVVAAQNPILESSLEPQPLMLPLGGEASAWVRISNPSVFDADDLEIDLVGGPIRLGDVEPVPVLEPFSNTLMELPLTPGEDAMVGDAAAEFELVYTYCIEDQCFQIVEELALSLQIVPATLEPVEDQTTVPVAFPQRSGAWLWNIVFPTGLGLALVLALVAGRLIGKRWWILGLLIAVLAGGLGYGLSLKQAQQAQSIGAVLCTSCVGLEESPHGEPVLSADGRSRIAALDHEVELLVFTATWCHACPYAKAMVKQVAEINPLVSYQLVEVDEERDIADRYGIVQSGHTIVPAIVRVDTGKIVFGIDHLEDRLIVLLEAGP
jgi:thiol-disulfide isomerase/thioredoxin